MSAETLAILIDKGLSGADLVDVVRSIDTDTANAEPVRTRRQERNHRYYMNQKAKREAELAGASENVSIQTSDKTPDSDTIPSPKEKSPTPPKEITPTQSSLRSDEHSRADAKSILAEVLPANLASDVVAHRKALRAPLTAGSARGLAKAFSEFGDPCAAAQAMMTNGWRGFKSGWMTDAVKARAGPFTKRAGPSMAEMSRMDETDLGDDEPAAYADHRTKAAEPSNESRSGPVGLLPFEDHAHGADQRQPLRRVVNC